MAINCTNFGSLQSDDIYVQCEIAYLPITRSFGVAYFGEFRLFHFSFNIFINQG